MKQCPECNRYYPDFASSCKCGGEFPKPSKSEPEGQCEEETPDGSAILAICTLLAGGAMIISIGYGIFLVFKGHPIIGILCGVIGGFYNAGFMIVFDNVNDMIGERKMHNNRLNPISGSSIKLPEKD
jgi:hypothetical protein